MAAISQTAHDTLARKSVDKEAMSGAEARSGLELPERLFLCLPEHHSGVVRTKLTRLHSNLAGQARSDGRIPATGKLVKRLLRDPFWSDRTLQI